MRITIDDSEVEFNPVVVKVKFHTFEDLEVFKDIREALFKGCPAGLVLTQIIDCVEEYNKSE